MLIGSSGFLQGMEVKRARLAEMELAGEDTSKLPPSPAGRKPKKRGSVAERSTKWQKEAAKKMQVLSAPAKVQREGDNLCAMDPMHTMELHSTRITLHARTQSPRRGFD